MSLSCLHFSSGVCKLLHCTEVFSTTAPDFTMHQMSSTIILGLDVDTLFFCTCSCILTKHSHAAAHVQVCAHL